MGLTSSDPEYLEEKKLHSEHYSSHPTPTFISSAATQYRLLSQFRGALSLRECLYTFATLLQQYSEMLSKRQDIIISDQNCKVSPFGEIIVSARINNVHGNIQNKYTQMMEKLFDLVSNLSIESEWTKNKSVMRLKQKVKKIISISSCQQQLFNNIFEQFSQFLQKAKMHTNLVGALARLNQYSKRKFTFQDSVKLNNNRKEHSFATISVFSSSLNDNIGVNSNRNQQKQKKSIFSHYHQKSKLNQNSSQNQSYYEDIRFQDSFQSQSQTKTNFMKKKCTHKFYISPQYSINIHLVKKTQQRKATQPIKVKRDRYRTQKLRQACVKQHEEKKIMRLPKNKTSIQLNYPKVIKRQSIHQNSPKSVLDTMARLVQVKETSSSKSHIY